MNFKKGTKDNKSPGNELRAKKIKNNINKFLNSYFKLFLTLLIFVFLWASFRFVLQPKFKKIAISSETVLEKRKQDFLSEYNNLENYKKIILEFSKINQEDIYKIEKVVPSQYSRDDLFMEITYFLIKNNFKIKNVNIIDPKSNPVVSVAETSNRRPALVNENIELPKYSKYTNSLPVEIGSWVADVELTDVDYLALKYLLDILENNLRLFDVFSLDFNPSEKTAKIGILTYYYKNN